MAKKNKTTWHKSNMDILDEQLDFLDGYGEREDIPRLELDFGDTEVRILPGFDDRGIWIHRYSMHWNLPVSGDQTTFRCARDLVSPRECLFCESAELLQDQGRDDLYNRWRAKPRYDFNVVKVDEPDRVLVMSLPPKVAKSIMEVAKKYGDPTDPENGYNFTITKKKTGPKQYNVEYTALADRDSSELEDWSVLEDLIQLDDIFPAPTLEAQKEALQIDTSAEPSQGMLEGAVEEAEDGDDDDDIIAQTVSDDDDEDDSDDSSEEERSVSELLKERLSGGS